MKRVIVKSGNTQVEAFLLETMNVGKYIVRKLKSDKGYGIYSSITGKTFWGYTELGADVSFKEWIRRFKNSGTW